MGELLTTYLTRFLRDPEGFQRNQAAPVLVFEPPQEPAGWGEKTYQLHTVSSAGANSISLVNTLATVCPVKKVKDNAFQRGVTVGRTSNNDVVLDHLSVSRFHAWFQRDEKSGIWSICDAGSKNGTKI